MRFWRRIAVISTLVAVAMAASQVPAAVSEARVREIAAMLPAEPAGLGRPISDRDAWKQLAREKAFQDIVKRAEELAAKPIPDQPDDLYLDFSKTGNRSRWQGVANQRRGRIGTFCLAECIENKGRFLKPLEEIIRAVCAERTWVMPAHDGRLTNFNRSKITIDLGSSMLSWNFATVCYLLGDKLSPEVRDLLRERTEHFIFQPYRDMVNGKRDADWWTRTTNNWNAVCLGGVTGSALAWIEKPEDRAFFVAAAEDYSLNFLKGFTPDGYCTEGLGYWNYGFGYYVLLGETVWQATGGKLDLLARPSVQGPARFASNIEIVNRTYPAFADCGVTAKPSGRLMHYLSLRFGLGLTEWEKVDMITASNSTYESCIYSFPNSATLHPAKPSGKAAGPGIRSFFKDAGILICRPASADAYPFGVALKGGHNAEHHNHNDVGSYVVVDNQWPLAVDPGGEAYTKRTFSAQRYVSGVLNSLGHPVPRVAGKLQRKGRQAHAKVVRADFTDARDTLVLDIASAYDVPELEKLERTFVYSREGKGSLTIEDRFAFHAPEAFGTAVITLNQWRQAAPDTVYLYNSNVCLEVRVSAEGGQVALLAETVEDGKRPTRIGIDFTEPVGNGTIRVVMRPIDLPKGLPGIYRAPGGVSFKPDLKAAVVVQAEDFTAQTGGDVSVGEKIGAEGKAFKFWDPKDHTLEWKFSVPADGAYTIQLRQCHAAPNSGERDIYVDGKPVGKADLKGRFLVPATGGWSSAQSDWQDTWMAQEGDPLRVELKKGEHTLKMVNADGKGVNLDLIRIVPLR